MMAIWLAGFESILVENDVAVRRDTLLLDGVTLSHLTIHKYARDRYINMDETPAMSDTGERKVDPVPTHGTTPTWAAGVCRL